MHARAPQLRLGLSKTAVRTRPPPPYDAAGRSAWVCLYDLETTGFGPTASLYIVEIAVVAINSRTLAHHRFERCPVGRATICRFA